MFIASKNEFFDVARPAVEDVEIKNDVFVRIAEIPATAFVDIWTDPKHQVEGKEGVLDLRKLTPALIAGSAVTEDGERIFDDEDIADIEKKVGSSVFLKLGAAARRINGVVAEKNSEASQGENSSSGSLSS